VGGVSAIRAILFDKDGTLIDFRSTWLAAYRGAAAELEELSGRAGLGCLLLLRSGYDEVSDRFTPESPLLWATNREIAARWAESPELAGIDDTAQRIQRHFSDSERYPPQATGDLPVLFNRLEASGLVLGIATMDSETKGRSTAAALGIDRHVRFIAGADSGYGEKPGPGMAQAFCSAVGVDPAQVMVVGDTHADLHMARNAGCALAVAVLTGGAGRDVLAPLADHVLASVMEVETLL